MVGLGVLVIASCLYHMQSYQQLVLHVLHPKTWSVAPVLDKHNTLLFCLILNATTSAVNIIHQSHER